MSAASTTHRSRARAAVRPMAADLGRPGVAELVGAGVATLVLAGAAIAGISNATGRPVDAGVSVALAGGGANATEIAVRNGSATPFRGRLVVAGGVEREVAVAPGETSVVEVVAPDDCTAPVSVTLEGPGAPSEPVDLPCPGAQR